MNEVKKLTAGAISQLRDLWRTLFFLYLPIGLLFMGVGILSRMVEDASLAFFLRDVVATGELPFFAGFVSQIGMILWSASLTVCLFSLIVMRHRNGGLAASNRFLLHGGILTGMLLLDDIFLFHEEIAPDYLHIGEKYVIAVYLIMGLIFVLSNLNEILSSEYLILGLALVMFGASIFLDAIPIDEFDLRYFWEQLELFLEDGFKFAGIATWLTYFVRYAVPRIQDVQSRPSLQS
jgi:hypothetical protein